MAQQMDAPGYLLMGAAETVLGVTDAFKPVQNSRGLYSIDPARTAMTRAA
jgi:chemotaxis protein methyltransferase CheR